MKSHRFYIIAILSTGLMLAMSCSVSTSNREPDIEFFADRTSIQEGECVTFFWAVEDTTQVRFNNSPEQNSGSNRVCPKNTTTYALSAKNGDDTTIKKVTIQVQKQATQSAPAQNNDSDQKFEAFLNFWADRTIINKGECTNLHWQTSFPGVWIGEKQYPADSQMEICPSTSTEYNAEIGDQVIEKQIIIQVIESGTPQQAQQQPAQQKPPVQQPEAAQPKPTLSFTYGQEVNIDSWSMMVFDRVFAWEFYTVMPGKEITLHLNRPANVTVYLAGNPLPKKVSSDGMTITVTIPANFEYGFIELKGDGEYAKSKDELFAFYRDPSFKLNTDLAVTDLYPTNMPMGQIFARITNRGPAYVERTSIDLVCNAILSPQADVIAPANPINLVKTYTINIQHNETQIFDTGISNDTDSFKYVITCTVRPHEKTYFGNYEGNKVVVVESNNANNTYKEQFP